MRNFGKKITVNSLFALAFFCLFTFTANAANITWDGGGADNNWSTAANWSGDVVPTNADRVFFNATSTKNATIDVPVTVDWLIEAAGYTGTITQADGQTMNLTQFEIDAGTFQGGAADANFDQVYIYGGTFNAPSGTLTARIFNNQDPTAPIGIFNANGGTVKISSPTNFATLSGYYPLTFNNLILAAQTSEGGTAIDASVAGTLTFNANGGLSDGFIKANGNVVFNSGYVGGIGEIRFVDTVTRTVNLDLSDVKQQILINNPNITVTTNGTASDTINWTQKVTIQSGTLQQSAANYTFSASGTGFLISGGTFQGSVGALNLNTSSTLSSGNLSGGAGTVGYSSGTPTFAQTGGTFSANGNAAFFFLNHTGGTLNAPSGTTTINSRFDSFNGTFNNNGGMFSFNASLINAPGRTFNNLTVNSGFNSISSPTPPIVAGTLSLVDGTLNSYTIRADGNISYASTFDGGSAQIEFSDVATRTVNLPANANMLAMLINNPNVTVKTDDAAASTFIGFSTEVRSGNFVQGNAPLNFGPGAVGGGNAYNLNITGGTFTGSSAALNFNNGGGLYITNGNFQGGTGPLVGAFGITINQSGGTFSTQGNVDITSFVLSGGTFNAPSGIMTVISDWTHISGGAFNAGTGTVKFTGYSVFNCANLMVINVNATETFNNLQFANQGCNTRFISSGDTLIVNGNLTLANNQLGGGRIRPLGAINIDPTFTSAGSTIVEFITPNTNFVISNPASTVAMLPIEMNAANSTLTSSGAGKINFSGATLLNGTLNQPNAIWDFTSYPGFTQSGGIFNGSAAQLNIANGINGNILTGGTFNGGTGLINGGWGQTGGTFSTQGDMNAAQFNLAGGIFNAPSGILDISAGFTHTAGGTFNPGSGTVQTSVLPGVYGMAFDVNTTENFNNLKFNGTYNNANHFIAAGDTLIVNGDLTFSGRGVSGGSIVANGNVFYQNFGAYRNATTVVRFEDTASRTITLCGDVSTCNGTYTSDTQPMLVNNPNIIINTGLTANGAMTIPALTLQQGIFNQNDGRVTMTNYNQSGGIYNGGTFSQSFGTLNSFTNFTLTGGDFNAAPSMTLDGNFTHTTASGNFNEGTGIVYFYSTFFGSNGTIDVNGNETFYNVAFYSGNGTNIAAGDTLTVNGTATLRTGTLNGGTINAKGNVDVLRAAVGGSFQGGTTNVVFSGSTDQTFSNQDGFASFGGTWTVNKPNSVTSAENNFAPAAPTNLLISGNIGRSFAGIYVPLNLVSGNAVQTGAYSHGFSSLTVSPAASFVNEFGGTITLSGDVNNDGIIRLNANGAGCQADSILIRSNNATQRNWNGAGYFFMTDVDVSGQAGTPLITVYNGTNSGNNGANWIFNGSCFVPTSANVSVGGKVLNAEGNGIANVRIILTDAQGNSRVAVSNSFGNYRFDEVAAGQTVTLSANSKKFNFTNPTQILNVLENVSEMNFIAEGR